MSVPHRDAGMHAGAPVTAAPRPGNAAAQARASVAPLWFLYTAVAALVAFCSALVALAPESIKGTLSPHVLALIHLATLGMLTTAIMGALLQLLPVILVVPAPSDRLGRGLYAAWTLGVGALIGGFWSGWWPALAAGGTLVVLTTYVFAGLMWRVLLRAPRRPLAAYYVAAALAYLVLVVSAGLALAVDRNTGVLGAWLLRILPAHLLLGFVGWAIGMVMGVSYKLAPMFALAHVRDERPGWACFYLLNGGLVLLAASVVAGWPRALGLAAAVLVLLAVALFLFDMARVLRSRHRKALEPTQWHALTGPCYLLLCGALAWRDALGDAGWWLDGRTATALGVLFLLGFVAQTIMGYLYKIVPFLVWNRRYAPLVGRRKVPVMRELLHERPARWIFWLFNAGVAALVVAIVAVPWLVQPAALAVAVAAWAFGATIVAVLRPPAAFSHETTHGRSLA